MTESSDSESGDDVVPLNEETQIALPSDENECRLALPVTIPSFKLNKGNFDRANFGPQTNTKHIEANTIEHATITHVHHHYGGDDKSQESPSTSGATGTRPKQEREEGIVQITDDIFMNTKKPLKEGLKIYKGYQEHVTGQRLPLAIKVIFPLTEKCIREVQHLVNLVSHPNVVRIIRSKVHKTHLPTLYIAMELCASKNLHDYLNENREKNTPFDFKKTMSYSRRLVKAIKHIHRNRIIHGDLKPENILFSLDGDQIKISDFGISRDMRKSRSSTKLTSHGTDGYRAPETYNSDVISMKADIYSLGVTLYCLWTNGKHPFGPNPYRWIVNIMDNTGRDLSCLPEEMGSKKDEFLDLLDKMLQVDPENRPTIEEISQHPFLSSSQVTAQASLTSQLSLVISSEEGLPEMPFVAPTTPESSLAFEETRPKEGREEIMQIPDHGLSHLRESAPEEATQRVLASVQTHPKKDRDSYPSSEKMNAIVDGTNAGRKNSVRSGTLRKMKNLGMDVDKLNVWRVTVESDVASTTSVIRNMDQGCRICSFEQIREAISRSERVKINEEERLISDLDDIKLPLTPLNIKLGIVVWFDYETLQLYVKNLSSGYTEFRTTFNLDFSPLPEKISVPIFAIKKFVDCIERKKRQGEETGEEGVEIKVKAYSWPSRTIFTIRIIPEGILQSRIEM